MDNFRIDYILFIKNIEKNYDVNSYLVNEVKIWPLLRNILFEIVSRHREYSLKQKIYEKLINLELKNVKKEPQGKSPIFNFASKEDILFISDDHFYIKSHSRYSNKYLDPIFEELSKIYNVKKLHLSTQLSGKKNIISYQIQNKSISEIINIGIDVLNFLDQLKKEVRNSKFKNINVENLEFTLKRKLEDINEGKNFIENLVVKPQYIFYSSYAHPFKIGVNIASKLHKIKTIDVQHGIQGKNNPNYTNWTRVPNEKYEMLPDWFWTWNEVSKKRIMYFDDNSLTGLNATVSGYRFLENYNKNKNIYFDVLFTLQPLFFNQPTYIQSFVLKFIKEYQKINWVIKPHPKHNIRDMVKIEKIFNFKNTKISTQENVFELLKGCKLHVTEFSSTAYEGLYFNVPTIFTNEIAVEEFPDELKNNLFHVGTNYDDFKNSFFSILSEDRLENLIYEEDRKYVNLYPLKAH